MGSPLNVGISPKSNWLINIKKIDTLGRICMYLLRSRYIHIGYDKIFIIIFSFRKYFFMKKNKKR